MACKEILAGMANNVVFNIIKWWIRDSSPNINHIKDNINSSRSSSSSRECLITIEDKCTDLEMWINNQEINKDD